MFEDIHEIAENSAYLKAVEEKDVSLEMLEQLPPYEELKDLEEDLRRQKLLNFQTIFSEPTGFYMIKCFLIADYAVDKAIFIKDIEAYRSMRFESARRKIAKLLYWRFVALDGEQDSKFPKGSSVFQLIRQEKQDEEKGNPTSVTLTPSGALLNVHNNMPMDTHSNMGYQLNVAPGPNAGMGSARAGNSARGNDGKDVKSNDFALGMHGIAPPHTVNAGNSNLGQFEHKRQGDGNLLQIGSMNNPIGVYGKVVRRVKERVMRGESPKDLFDEVAHQVMNDLKLDAFPRFKQSEFYKKYIRCKSIESMKVSVKDFTTFRVLGRGGFGAVSSKFSTSVYFLLYILYEIDCLCVVLVFQVHACRKSNSGTLYAMKCINKKLVKVKSALDNVLEERNVLTMMKSNFVTNLKYALQDDDTLYLMCASFFILHKCISYFLDIPYLLSAFLLLISPFSCLVFFPPNSFFLVVWT